MFAQMVAKISQLLPGHAAVLHFNAVLEFATQMLKCTAQ